MPKSYIDQVLRDYNKIFGAGHHLVCEGKKCNCHKEVKSFLRKSLAGQAERVVKEERERILLVTDNPRRHGKLTGINSL